MSRWRAWLAVVISACCLSACAGSPADRPQAAYLGPDSHQSLADYRAYAQDSLAQDLPEEVHLYGLVTFPEPLPGPEAARVIDAGVEITRIAAIVPVDLAPIVVPEPSAEWDRSRLFETYLTQATGDPAAAEPYPAIRSLVVLAPLSTLRALAGQPGIDIVEAAEGPSAYGLLGIRPVTDHAG